MEIMKTVIYVYLEDSDEPEEYYLKGKGNDFTYDEIAQLLHKKYGKQGWMTFTYNKK